MGISAAGATALSGDPGLVARAGVPGAAGTSAGASVGSSVGSGARHGRSLDRARREARQAATDAARTAGVVVRRLTTPVEAAEAHALLAGLSAGGAPPAELLRTITFVGGYLFGAYAPGADGAAPTSGRGLELVGVAVGLPTIQGRSPRAGLHGYGVAVRPHAGTRAVGFALKVDQRAWALERGLLDVTWTFDPLDRRSAHLCLAKLAADPVVYLTDFHGPGDDRAGDEDRDPDRDPDVGPPGTDRVLVRWELDASHAAAACAGAPWSPAVPPGAETSLAAGPDGGPLAMAWPAGAPALLVEVPEDVAALRAERPDLGRAWRLAVRDVLGGLMQDGWAVAGFVRRSAYLVLPVEEHTDGVA